MQQVNLPQMLDQATALHQAGRLGDAARLYAAILSVAPSHFDARHYFGVLRYQEGRNDEALAMIAQALAVNPRSAEAHLHLGVVLQTVGRFAEALKHFDAALAIRPDYASAHNNRGNALRNMARPGDALASYEAALAAQPGHVEALYNRGVALWESKRYAEALQSYDGAIAAKPDYAEAFYNRGIALQDMKRPLEALASYDRALALRPDLVQAWNNRGNVLSALNRLEESLASFDRALALVPRQPEALNNRGVALNSFRRQIEALASYDAALAIKPDYADALYNRGINLWGLKRYAEALASYDAVLKVDPHHVEAIYNRGVVLQDQERFAEGFAAYEEALAARPDHPYALGGMAVCAQRLCDWTRMAVLAGRLNHDIAERKAVVSPLSFLGYSDDAALQRQCATNYVEDRVARPPLAPSPSQSTAPVHRHGRIRVAYLSADFHQHATAYLMAELFERHDRDRFEIVGVSFGHDDGSDMRARLVGAFDQFHDVRAQSDAEVARLLRGLGVDIAVDLKGHTQDARPGIFAHRPAPVQVNYLGYPGTMGADFIDYVIADATVLPLDQQSFYAEKIVHLPDCYQANDTRRTIARTVPSRAEMGLPQAGFVFCCFNNNWKITAPLFDIWMRLLHVVPGSVIWLLEDNEPAKGNLRREAAARAIDPDRLVFAARVAQAGHLARHRCADLFLDTLPYNAHTTASDALWMGVPLVTCPGETFAARVAASLLHAAGLQELIARDLAHYEALALELAGNPQRLQSLRDALERDRLTSPLFDTERFRRHIEAAYTAMWEIWQRGEAPTSLRIVPQA